MKELLAKTTEAGDIEISFESVKYFTPSLEGYHALYAVSEETINQKLENYHKYLQRKGKKNGTLPIEWDTSLSENSTENRVSSVKAVLGVPLIKLLDNREKHVIVQYTVQLESGSFSYTEKGQVKEIPVKHWSVVLCSTLCLKAEKTKDFAISDEYVQNTIEEIKNIYLDINTVYVDITKSKVKVDKVNYGQQNPSDNEKRLFETHVDIFLEQLRNRNALLFAFAYSGQEKKSLQSPNAWFGNETWYFSPTDHNFCASITPGGNKNTLNFLMVNCKVPKPDFPAAQKLKKEWIPPNTDIQGTMAVCRNLALKKLLGNLSNTWDLKNAKWYLKKDMSYIYNKEKWDEDTTIDEGKLDEYWRMGIPYMTKEDIVIKIRKLPPDEKLICPIKIDIEHQISYYFTEKILDTVRNKSRARNYLSFIYDYSIKGGIKDNASIQIKYIEKNEDRKAEYYYSMEPNGKWEAMISDQIFDQCVALGRLTEEYEKQLFAWAIKYRIPEKLYSAYRLFVERTVINLHDIKKITNQIMCRNIESAINFGSNSNVNVYLPGEEVLVFKNVRFDEAYNLQVDTTYKRGTGGV